MADTNISKLFVKENGESVIVSWHDWDPTPELRWNLSMGPSGPKVLQQRWERFGVNSLGYIDAREGEWRDVPTTC